MEDQTTKRSSALLIWLFTMSVVVIFINITSKKGPNSDAYSSEKLSYNCTLYTFLSCHQAAIILQLISSSKHQNHLNKTTQATY